MPRTPRKIMDLEEFNKGKRRGTGSGVRIRGFYRVNIVEHNEDGTPRIVGDSGWHENRVVSAGMQQYLAFALISSAGSKYVQRGILGSGGVPATNDTSLPGAFGHATGASSTGNRPVGATSTSVAGNGLAVSVQYAFTWASSHGFNTLTNNNISNIGLGWTEVATNVGTIFSGNTYGGSPLNTNQDVVQGSRVVGIARYNLSLAA